MTMLLKSETTNCYRYERRTEDGKLETLYLQKATVKALGLDPKKLEITLEVTQK